jgi:hypothetical protein
VGSSPMRVWSRCWAPPKIRLALSCTGVSNSLGPWIARFAKHLLSVVWPASGLWTSFTYQNKADCTLRLGPTGVSVPALGQLHIIQVQL